MSAVVLDGLNHVVNANGQSIEQTGNYRRPVLGGFKLTPSAKGECFVQANASR